MNNSTSWIRQLEAIPEFQAVIGPRRALLVYRGRRKIILEGGPWNTKRPPFAYNYVEANPPIRKYPTVLIVAGPGVSIRETGFPSFYTPSTEFPSVNIIRVQNLAKVPALDQRIRESQFKKMASVSGSPAEAVGGRILGKSSGVVIKYQTNGLDIIHTGAGQVLRIRMPNKLGSEKYAYQIEPRPRLRGTPAKLGQPFNVKIVKTPKVTVQLHYPISVANRGVGLVTGIVPLVYEVSSSSAVPVQGTPITKIGREVTKGIFQGEETLGYTLTTTATDTAVGFIPVAGDLVDISEFFFGIAKGYDRWGRPLTRGDLVLMGIGALLPFVGGSALRGAAKVARAGRNAPSELQRLVMAAQTLSKAERSSVERWTANIRRGGHVPQGEVKDALRLVNKLDLATKRPGRISTLYGPSGQAINRPGSQLAPVLYGSKGEIISGTPRHKLPQVLYGPKGQIIKRPRKGIYPGFDKIGPASRAEASSLVSKLSKQLGIKIPKDRVLDAPWVGAIYGKTGKKGSRGTSMGWLRYDTLFWSKYKELWPGDYKLLGKKTKVTKELVKKFPNLKGSKTIKYSVTEELAKKYGWSTEFVGDRLVHHHINNGRYVVAIPESLHKHKRLSKKIHAEVTVH